LIDFAREYVLAARPLNARTRLVIVIVEPDFTAKVNVATPDAFVLL
jgi:hypothetical protein